MNKKEKELLRNRFKRFMEEYKCSLEDNKDDSSTMTIATEKDKNSTMSSTPKYRCHPNVYDFFNRTERRMLERLGLNIREYYVHNE